MHPPHFSPSERRDFACTKVTCAMPVGHRTGEKFWSTLFHRIDTVICPQWLSFLDFLYIYHFSLAYLFFSYYQFIKSQRNISMREPEQMCTSWITEHDKSYPGNDFKIFTNYPISILHTMPATVCSYIPLSITNSYGPVEDHKFLS